MAMQAFQYNRVNDIEAAIGAGSKAGVKLVAGGTTLIDLMKLHVEQPITVLGFLHTNHMSKETCQELTV
jgi:xanthine dehydrogenase YagS FAD-binding subunit